MAKLIVQCDEDGCMYVYRESDTQYRNNERIRRKDGLRKLDWDDIAEECRVEFGEYMAIPIAHDAVKQRKRKAMA